MRLFSHLMSDKNPPLARSSIFDNSGSRWRAPFAPTLFYSLFASLLLLINHAMILSRHSLIAKRRFNEGTYSPMDAYSAVSTEKRIQTQSKLIIFYLA